MNMDTDNNIETTIKTPNQDALGRSKELLSTTQILTEQEQNLNNNGQQQPKKSKKKSHGNRRLQRFKRKCRSKGMNNQAIEMLMNIQKSNRLVHPDNQQRHEEQLNDPSITNTESDVKDSISFENQDHTNQHPDMKENAIDDLTIQSSTLQQSIATDERISTSPKSHENKIEHHNLSNDHSKQSSKSIPNYKDLSLSSFKDLLTKAIPIRYQRQRIEQWLATNSTMVLYIQVRAELMCPVIQLKFTLQYWNFLANFNEIAIIRLSGIFKDVMKKENSVNLIYSKTKINIQDHQNIIRNKLQQAQHHLNLHSKQAYPLNWPKENKTSVDHLMTIITNALTVLIQNDLFYFLTNLQNKVIITKFKINDSYLLKLFYDLKPTEEQVRSAKQIWQAKIESCQRTMDQNKKNHSLNMDQTTTEEEINQEQQIRLTSIESFIPSMRTIIKARLTNIETLAQQLIKFSNTIDENIFF